MGGKRVVMGGRKKRVVMGGWKKGSDGWVETQHNI